MDKAQLEDRGRNQRELLASELRTMAAWHRRRADMIEDEISRFAERADHLAKEYPDIEELVRLGEAQSLAESIVAEITNWNQTQRAVEMSERLTKIAILIAQLEEN